MIPTKVSDLDNDAQYITADALSGLGGGDMLKATYDTDGDGVVDNAEKLGGVAASEYAKKTDVPTVPTNVGAFTNDAGYLTSYTETDPTVPSHVKGITTGDITNWNAKATTNYVDTKVAGIVDTAPEALNTLNELAAALGDDPNFATTVMTEIGKKVDKTTTVNGHALSGDVTITSVEHATSADSATAATTATSAIQDNQGRNIVNTYATKTELNGKADSGYGFGESANVTVSDIDSLTKTGFYQFVTDVFDGNPTNYYLIHQIHTDNYACQTAIKVINASVVYQRTKQGGTWGNWIKYITSGNIGSQSVASATKLATARNINGVAFDGTSNVTIPNSNALAPFRKSLTTNQWYRVATISETMGFSCKVQITSSYNYTTSISHTLLINAGYGNSCAITQINGANTTAVVSKVRAVKKTSSEWYLEIYYSGHIAGNTVEVSITDIAVCYDTPASNAVTAVDFTAGEIPEGYTATEFELSINPIKASAFEGALKGNADTATCAGSIGKAGDTSNPMYFMWAGKDEMPPWVWGGTDGTNMYVYNPANFSVASAKSLSGGGITTTYNSSTDTVTFS